MQKEIEKRVLFIKDILRKSGADGIVVGNSGGKDCALCLILCKMATDNVLSVMMPCESKQNYESDLKDARELCEKFGIKNTLVDLSDTKSSIENAIGTISFDASKNIAPRLRMTALYAIAQSKNYLVCGTGNACERIVGYFTKWGDGAHDFNPISDLLVSEIYKLLEYLDAPSNIIKKAPSAGLFDGQTDEKEMGVLYDDIEKYLKGKSLDEETFKKIDSMAKRSQHKRDDIVKYKGGEENA